MLRINDIASRKLRAPFECDDFEEHLYLSCIRYACDIQDRHTGVDSEKLAVSVLRTLGWLANIKES